MDQSLIVRVLPDPDRLARVAAADIAAKLRRAIASRGAAHFVLAGGETPLSTYRCLARAPLVDSVDWRRVHFWWTDERWVAADQPSSNQGAARAALLDRVAPDPARVHAIDVTTSSAPAAAADYEQRLRRCFGAQLIFDVVLLGVGEDGHVASLFPGSSELTRGNWVVVECHAPKPPALRISLNLPALAAAHCHVLLAQGTAKASILRRLCEGGTGELPIERLLAITPPVRAYVDQAAWSPDARRATRALRPKSPGPRRRREPG